MRIILYMVLCTIPVSANLFKSVYNELQQSETTRHLPCELRTELRDCDPPVSPESPHALPGTVCRDETGYYKCYRQGQWVTEAVEEVQFQTFGHSRKKRFLPFFIGAAIGIGACLLFCGGGGGGGGSPPNIPPTVECPSIGTQRPPVGTSMVVTWTEPMGNDNEQGTLSADRNGPAPGSVFEEGTHMISYRVTDNGGLSDTCYMSFTVKSYHCSDLQWPRDGTRSCTNQYISGSTCTISCDPGYEIEGPSSLTCDRESWNGTMGRCAPKSCEPTPDVTDGSLVCFGVLTYNTYCQLTCDEGFQPEGVLTSMCNEDGQWTTPGTCADSEPPVFISGCPSDITDYAEDQNQPKVVTWPDPEVTDNKGEVTISYNPAKGSQLPVGQTIVNVRATDENKNSRGCTFTITINSLQCREPDLGDDKLIFDCPDGYGAGYSCTPSCRGNFPKAGSSSILCKKDESTFPPNATWTWPDDSLEPFCKIVDCPPLPLPQNGALACDGWTYGLVCVMSCNEKYDVPFSVPDQYICGEQTGIWLPNDRVLDCNVMRLAGEMTLLNEFYYYSGSCENEETRTQIAQNFITILTNNVALAGICGPSEPNCRVEFVDVRCGETTERKRRETNGHISRRQTHFIAIKFAINQDLTVENDETFSDARLRVQENYNRTIAAVKTMTESGQLDMPDRALTVQSGSYRHGYPKIKCQDGVPDHINGSCRGCPKGTYTNGTEDCIDCPVGTYNDVDFASTCKRCDEGTSTKSTGTKSPSNCTDLCPVGSYSSDGMKPCILCDPGTFSDTIGSTQCASCSETTTSLQGATDCVSFDVIVSGPDVVIGEVTSDLTAMSLTFWFHADTSVGHGLLMLQNPDGNTIVSVSVTNTLFIEIDGNSVDTEAQPISNRWQQVTMTINGSSKELVLYLMGQEVYRGTGTSLGNPVVPDTSSVRATAADNSFLLSGINVYNRVVSLQEVQSMAGSCTSSLVDSMFTLSKSGEGVSVPSHCDAVDGCKASPCGSHQCEDTLEGFLCNCQDGYTGNTCQIPPDFCANHECQNGANCQNTQTNYTCKCQQGFKGTYCQYEIVNGKWSDWSTWTICSKSCDGGSQSRTRVCDNPPPDDDGEECEGMAKEISLCNSHNCQECPELIIPEGNEKDCTEEEGLQICHVTCRRGMAVTRQKYLLARYECGAASKYKWNHEKSGFNNGQIPQCTRTTGANTYIAVYTVTYSEISCEDGEKQETAIQSQISDNISYLPCVKDNSCRATIQSKSCEVSAVKKRAVQPTVVSITVTTEMNRDIDEDIAIFYDNGTVTDKLRAYVEQVLQADTSVQQLVNDSASLLQLTLNGVTYNIDPDNTETTVRTICPQGNVPTEGVCAACPRGSREVGGSCVSCAKGSYQDQAGSTSCKLCPQGKTTPDVGAVGSLECTVDDFDITLTDGETSKVELNVSPMTFDLKTGFKIRTWLMLGWGGDILTLKSSDSLLFSLNATEHLKLQFSTESSSQSLDMYLMNYKWYQVLLTYDSSNLTIYVGSTKVFEETWAEPSWTTVSSMSVVIGGNGMEGSISQLNVWSNGSHDQQPTEFSCPSQEVGDVVAWDMFTTLNLTEAFLQIPSICDDTNSCDSNPCQFGICFDNLNGYTCDCDAGYEGTNCEDNIDDCPDNLCNNGATCLNGVSSYTCLCTANYTGQYCDANLVHGNWGAWGNWSVCSTICGPGQRRRVRLCDDPLPQNGGTSCPGSDEETGVCNDELCPAACPRGSREVGGSCVPCAKGSYQDQAGSTSCKLCPQGKTTPDVRAVDILECTVDDACPPGTRKVGGSCVSCAKGSYQDQPGSTSCKLCPQGWTTPDVGAVALLECRVNAEEQDETDKESEEKDDSSMLRILVPCITIGVIAMAAVVIVIAWRICSRKSRPRSTNSMQVISVKSDLYLTPTYETGLHTPKHPLPPPDYE